MLACLCLRACARLHLLYSVKLALFFWVFLSHLGTVAAITLIWNNLSGRFEDAVNALLGLPRLNRSSFSDTLHDLTLEVRGAAACCLLPVACSLLPAAWYTSPPSSSAATYG